ncbi:sulfite exporter TauE/SafE family protein [Endothiovibrio diazotrophicus]
MQPEYDYAVAFMAGILGSGHCVGMCGSLVSAFFIKMGDRGRGVLPYGAYHGGRITVYVLIGIAAGLLGLALTSTGFIGKAQGVLKIIAGLIVILLGLDILGVGPWRVHFSFLPLAALRRRFIAATEQGPVIGALVAGVVNGLMPCSLTLSVAVKATTAGGPLQGGLLMLAFGLGTLPSMLFVSAVFGKLGAKLRGQLLKIAAVFVIALGISTVIEGVNYFQVMQGLANW